MSTQASTFDEILRCAAALILQGGYNGFSYADIAEVVGIRKASIHHHFPGKVDLVRTLVERYRQEAERAVADLGRQLSAPVDQLRAYADFWEACIGDGSRSFCLCALLASEIPVLPPPVTVEIKAYFCMFSSWLTDVMQRGQEQEDFVLSRTAQLEAESFMATVHGAMLSARAYGDPGIFSAIIHPLIERLVADK